LDRKNAPDNNELRGRWPNGKQFAERITLPLSREMLTAIDAWRDDKETRLDVIRQAIERELDRRKYLHVQLD
jgi:metal-responsive CopG/Arc/MetJ family transcriptional regulator